MTPGFQFDYDQVNPMYAYDIDNPYLNATSSSNKLGLVTLNPINDYNKKLKWRSDHTSTLESGLLCSTTYQQTYAITIR